MNGTKIGGVGPKLLDNGEKWEPQVSFVPSVAGENQKIEFFVFEEGESEPHNVVYLLLDVR